MQPQSAILKAGARAPWGRLVMHTTCYKERRRVVCKVPI